MLGSIKSITKFGVFNNHSNEIPFLRFNLIYGWNGAGKSTLSRVFDSLSGIPSTVFPEGNFKVSFQNVDYTKDTIASSGIRIATFNQDFVKNNLNFETHKAKSLLYISEEKIDEKRKLEQKQEDLKSAKADCIQRSIALKALSDEISSEHTRIAKNVKGSFGLVQTQNKKFLNYDKRKLETFLESNKDRIKGENILSDVDIEKNKLASQATQKSSLQKISWPFNSSEINNYELKASEIAKKNIVAAQIQKLTENQDLNKWVEIGLSLHRQAEVVNCEFCGNQVSEHRLKELEAHFSKEYQTLLSDIASTSQVNTNLIAKLEINLQDSGDLYAEFQSAAKRIKSQFDSQKLAIKAKLEQSSSVIEEKKQNPFKSLQWDPLRLVEDFAGIEKVIKEFNDLVEDHNKKTADFEASVNKANDALELHFISDQLSDGALTIKKENAISQDKELKNAEKKRDEIEAEVRELESKLVNVAIAADKFNKELENFLGRSDIVLEFKKEHGGYLFFRNGRREVASNLSEGEKTAIAFIYFITKLKEAGSKIENTITVLDDPISSFDSKNLHSAFGFIQKHLGESRQLFVLTHNFEFFKLVRNWLKKKNENAKNAASEKAKFYLLQSTFGEGRTSEIVNLSPHLLNYESEYHFLFGKVLKLRDTVTPSFEEAHFIGNGSRKILEAFLAFKFPSHKGDFAGLLKKACEEDTNTFQKVYSFINRYSHSQTLEVFESGSDNLFAESQNIVVEVFQIIKKMDHHHFEEMEKLCS